MKWQMRSAAAVVLCALGIVPALGAQHLTVIAKDSADGAPLADVLVALLDTSAALLSAHRTDRDGRVVIPVSDAGYYALRAQRIGWRPVVSDWIPMASSDTLEITMRLARISVKLSPVVIEAQRDSISRLMPFGINLKSLAGRVIVPAEVAAHALSARDYVDVIGSVAAAGLVVNYWRDGMLRERRCIGSSRSVSRRDCVAIYVNNVRTDPEDAVDLVPPEQLDFAIWLRAPDAGVLYGTGSTDGVLLLFTKSYRRVR